MTKFTLKGDYIALCDLLNIVGIAQSGGQAKHIIADGLVTVNGVVELRKRCKIREGETVECQGEQFQVVSE